MTLRLEAMPDDPSMVAFLSGPIVLAADLGTAGLDHASRYGKPAPEMALEETPSPPALLAASVGEALARIQPTASPLVFHSEDHLVRRLLERSEGSDDHPETPSQDVELRPFFRLTDRRYAVYFPVISPEALAARAAQVEAAAQARTKLDARTVDRVQPGLIADEERHRLVQTGSEAGRFEGRLSRSIFWGKGEFSYLLKLPAVGPAVLRFECWGGESRRRRFDVVAGGEVIAAQTLFDDRPGDTLPLEHSLPERVTSGHDSIRIGFRTVPGGSIGAIFDVRIVRPARERTDGAAHP
jgi:hypothetical protein